MSSTVSPDDQERIWVLHCRRMTQPSIAEEVGIPQPTVHRIIKQRRKAERELAERWGVPGAYCPPEVPPEERRRGSPGKGKPGFIYFIHAAEVGLVEIGWSLDPRKRLAMLKVGCPVDLQLLGTAGGRTLADEPDLHFRLRHLRVRGKWFTMGPELALAIIGEAGDSLGSAAEGYLADIAGGIHRRVASSDAATAADHEAGGPGWAVRTQAITGTDSARAAELDDMLSSEPPWCIWLAKGYADPESYLLDAYGPHALEWPRPSDQEAQLAAWQDRWVRHLAGDHPDIRPAVPDRAPDPWDSCSSPDPDPWGPVGRAHLLIIRSAPTSTNRPSRFEPIRACPVGHGRDRGARS